MPLPFQFVVIKVSSTSQLERQIVRFAYMSVKGTNIFIIHYFGIFLSDLKKKYYCVVFIWMEWTVNDVLQQSRKGGICWSNCKLFLAHYDWSFCGQITWQLKRRTKVMLQKFLFVWWNWEAGSFNRSSTPSQMYRDLLTPKICLE